MTSTSNWTQIKARLAATPWLIAIASILTLYGWFSDENTIIFGWSAFYLKLLTLPLLLAFITGANPELALINPDDSEDFWKVSSISFKIFLVLIAATFLLFRLNKS